MRALRIDRSSLANAVLGGVLLLLLFFQLLSISGHVGSDFKIFYNSAVRFNEDPFSLYSPESVLTLQGYLYPPPAMMLLRGFPAFELATAYALFVFLLYALIVASACMWMKIFENDSGLMRFSLEEKFVGVVAAGAAGPVFSAAASGQVDALILFICSIYALLLRREKFLIAGLVISLGFWIKIYPVLLLIYALSGKGRLALLPGFLIGLIAVPVALLAWIPMEIYVDYFLNYLPNLSRGTIINIYNQSLSAFLMRMMMPAANSLGSFDAVEVMPLVRIIVLSAAGGFLIYVAGYLGNRKLKMIALAVVISTSSWLAPLGWGHTYVYMLPVMLLLWGVHKASYKGTNIYVFWMLYFAMVLPVYHHFSWLPSTSDLLSNLIYSRYLFFGFAFVLMTLVFMRKARSR